MIKYVYLCIVGFKRWVFTQLWVCVLIVDVVPDANKLLPAVGACDQHNGHPHCIALGNQARVGGIRLPGAIQDEVKRAQETDTGAENLVLLHKTNQLGN